MKFTAVGQPLCTVCGIGMVTRQGRFGEFWACPNSNRSENHGTFTRASSQRRSNSIYYSSGPSLMHEIRTQEMRFGVQVSELEEFMLGDPEDINPEEPSDDDHWSNMRPY